MITLISDIIKRGTLIKEYNFKSQYDDGYPITYKVQAYKYTAYIIEITYENNIVIRVNINAI